MPEAQSRLCRIKPNPSWWANCGQSAFATSGANKLIGWWAPAAQSFFNTELKSTLDGGDAGGAILMLIQARSGGPS
jgi:hypothetical protein